MSNGAVERFRRVQTAKGRHRSGLYSIEGLRLMERALRAGISVREVLLSAEILTSSSARIQAVVAALTDQNVALTPVSAEVMADFTQGRDLGGMLGLIALPDLPDLATLVGDVAAPLLLVACDVVDPGNVGAMARTAHALGLTGMVTVGVSDAFHPKAMRTSMGSLFKLPLTHVASAELLLIQLREMGITAVGTSLEASLPLPELVLPAGGAAVWLGSEAWGLDSAVVEQLDLNVHIPMPAGVDSFSVNAAAAIVLYELRRDVLRRS